MSVASAVHPREPEPEDRRDGDRHGPEQERRALLEAGCKALHQHAGEHVGQRHGGRIERGLYRPAADDPVLEDGEERASLEKPELLVEPLRREEDGQRHHQESGDGAQPRPAHRRHGHSAQRGADGVQRQHGQPGPEPDSEEPVVDVPAVGGEERGPAVPGEPEALAALVRPHHRDRLPGSAEHGEGALHQRDGQRQHRRECQPGLSPLDAHKAPDADGSDHSVGSRDTPRPNEAGAMRAGRASRPWDRLGHADAGGWGLRDLLEVGPPGLVPEEAEL